MTATFHPNSEALAEYALGALSPGMELLVSGHLTFCPVCRERVQSFEALGGAAMGAVDMDNTTGPSLDATLAMLDLAPSEPVATAPQKSIFPQSLQAFVPADQDSIDWSFRLPGIYEHQLQGFEGEAVSLLKAKPGAKMLSHTHEGEEATLILSGQMYDGGKVYAKGDVNEADDHHDHRPEIIGDEMCVCLVVMSGKMRFTGTIGRALNVLMR